MKKELTKNSVTPFVGAEDSAEMKNLVLSESIKPLEIGELIEGTVLSIDKMEMYVEIPLYGTGIIYGREYMNARDMIKNINVGDTVKGKVVDLLLNGKELQDSFPLLNFEQITILELMMGTRMKSLRN